MKHKHHESEKKLTNNKIKDYMTHGTIQIVDSHMNQSVYLQRRHSGYPEGLGKDLKFIINKYTGPQYSRWYLDIACRLLKHSFMDLELSPFEYNPEVDNAEYVYVVDSDTLKIKAYYEGKRIKMPK